MKKALAIILWAVLAVVAFGHPRKITKLWVPDVAPPGPPGMEAVVHDGMPLPGGKSDVSPEEFAARRKKGVEGK